MTQFHALAYQYLNLPDLPNLRKDSLGPEERAFADLLERLGFDIFSALEMGGSKRSKYSYPDLYRFDPSAEIQTQLRAEFDEFVKDFRLDKIYVVYVAQLSPHLGFTAALTMQLSSGTLKSGEALRSYLKPEGASRSRFHAEMDNLLAAKWWHKKLMALPLIVFSDDEEPVVNPGIEAQVPTAKRMVSFERGFPYISYIIHATMEEALPSESHHNDLALLMASPFFIESNVFQKTRKYRGDVLEAMKALSRNDVGLAATTYQDAWTDFEPVQSLLPATRTALERITQKYPLPSFFAFIADDNRCLIDYFAEPAMQIADQVGRNLQTHTNQVLQRQYVKLTACIVGATVLAAVLAALLPSVLQTNLSPIALISGHQTEEQTLHALHALDVTSSPRAQGRFPGIVTLHFFPGTAALGVDLPIPEFGDWTKPFVVIVLRDNVPVVAGATQLVNQMAGLRVHFTRETFSVGKGFALQFNQSPNTVTVPMRIVFEESGK